MNGIYDSTICLIKKRLVLLLSPLTPFLALKLKKIKNEMKVTKTNPLLNEDLKKRSTSIIHKYLTHGVSVIDKIS